MCAKYELCVLVQATAGIEKDAQEAWQRQNHHPLITHVKPHADLRLRAREVRSEADPNEDRSSTQRACSAMIQLVESTVDGCRWAGAGGLLGLLGRRVDPARASPRQPSGRLILPV